MKESGYYPPGAEFDPKAPYNQSEPDPVEVNVIATYTISKSATVETSDYTADEWEECETDDEGNIYRTGGIDYDFSNTDFEKEFNNYYLSPLELFAELKNRVEKELETCTDYRQKNQLKRILCSCEEWSIDDYTFEKD